MGHMHDQGSRLWYRGLIYAFIILLLYCISSKSIDEGFVQSSLRSTGSSAVPHNNRQQKLDFLHGLVGLYNEQTRLFDFGKPLGTEAVQKEVAFLLPQLNPNNKQKKTNRTRDPIDRQSPNKIEKKEIRHVS